MPCGAQGSSGPGWPPASTRKPIVVSQPRSPPSPLDRVEELGHLADILARCVRRPVSTASTNQDIVADGGFDGNGTSVSGQPRDRGRRPKTAIVYFPSGSAPRQACPWTAHPYRCRLAFTVTCLARTRWQGARLGFRYGSQFVNFRRMAEPGKQPDLAATAAPIPGREASLPTYHCGSTSRCHVARRAPPSLPSPCQSCSGPTTQGLGRERCEEHIQLADWPAEKHDDAG